MRTRNRPWHVRPRSRRCRFPNLPARFARAESGLCDHRQAVRRSRARRGARGARASGPAARRRRRRRASRRRSRRPRRACCRRAGRGRARRRSRARSPSGRRGGHSRRRSSCPAGVPRAAGPRRCRSAPASSVVLPWSMWPAVPMTTVIGSADARRGAAERASARPAAGSTVRRSRMTRPLSIRADDRRGRRAAAPRAAVAPTPADRRPDRREGLAGQRAAADRRLGRRPTSQPCRGRRERLGAPARSPSTGVAIIRQTGISSSARPARYRPSVAATAASVTLSGRIARASGSRRIRAIRSARPTMSPACGPPTSLSPLNVTRSAPAARRSAGIGSWARPYALRVGAARRSRGRRRRSRRARGRGRPARRIRAPR